MKLLGRTFGALGAMASLALASWSCGPRSATTGVPSPPRTPPTAESPAPPPPKTEPAAPPTAGPPPAKIDVNDCAVIAEPGSAPATVALGDRIDPSNAPRPVNDAERLLFRQLYETLVRVDCKGRVGAGLAASWRLAENGRTWMVTLRDHARFSDGSVVTSNDVRAQWTRAGVGDELLPPVARLVESVVAVDDRTLAITLRHRRMDAPWPLAHADLAVAKTVAGSRWPLGTRVDRARAERDAGGEAVTTVARDNMPAMRFLVAMGDPRDVLDRDVDLVVTRDAAALDYAASLPKFSRCRSNGTGPTSS